MTQKTMYLELGDVHEDSNTGSNIEDTREVVPFNLEELDKILASLSQEEFRDENVHSSAEEVSVTDVTEEYAQNIQEVINLSTKEQFLASFVRQCEEYEENEEVEEIIFDGLVFRERTDMPALFVEAKGMLRNSAYITQDTAIRFNNCTMIGADFALWIDDYPLCVFQNTVLREGKFNNTQASGFVFTESNLAYADFAYSDLTNAQFKNSTLEGATFLHADLEGVTIDIPEHVQKEYLRGTKFDERILPLLPSVLVYGVEIPPEPTDDDDYSYEYEERYREE